MVFFKFAPGHEGLESNVLSNSSSLPKNAIHRCKFIWFIDDRNSRIIQSDQKIRMFKKLRYMCTFGVGEDTFAHPCSLNIGGPYYTGTGSFVVPEVNNTFLKSRCLYFENSVHDTFLPIFCLDRRYREFLFNE